MFDGIAQKFYGIFSRFGGVRTVSERSIADALVQMHDTLLSADVPYALVDTFIAEVKQEVIDKKISSALDAGDFFIKIVHDKLVAFLSVAPDALADSKLFGSGARIMVLGLQGAGKTTSIAKLAHIFKKRNNTNVLVSSIDFTRPAAHEQLALLAQQAGATSYQSPHKNVCDATHDVIQYYKTGKFSGLFLDTAGRMQVDTKLLDELVQVAALVQPTYKLLVLDAMTGQQVLSVARAFNDAVGVDGVLLTKMDSDAAAGAALACTYGLKKPIVLVGTGEHVEDCESFYPDRVAKRMLGMGDVQSLLDRVNERLEKSEQEQAQEKFLAGNFTLDDFAQQVDMMGRLGSLTSIMRFLPGGMGISAEQLRQGERVLRGYRVMIDSMTTKERIYPAVLDKSRIARVARGAGVTQAEVRELLVKFEQSKQFVKLIRKNGLLRK